LYIITNGKLVLEDEVLSGYDILIEDNIIAGIKPSGSYVIPVATEVVDARLGYVSPGFIDIHADYIEHMAAPRPSSIMDFRLSLKEAEKELITHGITTMFHSLSIYKYSEFLPNPIRMPENTRKFIDLIDSTHRSKHLIRHRFHARFEIDNVDRIDELVDYITEKKVHLVSFMDHTPGQGQYRNLETYRKILKGYRNLSDASIDEIIAKSQSREKMTMDGLRRVADIAIANNIAVASHDDDSIAKVHLVRGFGTTITEFPVTMEVAAEASRLGMHTVAGAPNVILGGSHSGNISAAEAIREKTVDILASDYYPAALLHAVFFLVNNLGLGLCEMMRLVTINPARAVRMDDTIGSIKEGKRADIIVINRDGSDFPVITNAFVDGKPIMQLNYRE
jgi:phosphonate metabolism protein PhnM